MKAVYIEKEKLAKIVDIKPTLKTYYKMLDCDLIDIPSRKIGDHYYDIICDDEGLLKDSPIVTAVNKSREPMLVGSLLIVNHDEEGNEIGLTDEELIEVMDHIQTVWLFPTEIICDRLICEY